MKKGISIWSFPSQPLEESFKLAKAAGFDGVELALDTEGEVNLLPVDCAPGSVAFVINTSKAYMLNGEKDWVEI